MPATVQEYYRIQVELRDGLTDSRGESLLKGIRRLGVDGITGARYSDLYFLAGEHLSAEEVYLLCATLLYDPVIEVAGINAPCPPDDDRLSIEIGLLPGVTDTVAEEICRAAWLVGVDSLEHVATGQRVTLFGCLDEAALHTIAGRLLCNDAIQHYSIGRPLVPSFLETVGASGHVETIPLRNLDENDLLALSRRRGLALNSEEMLAIRDYFRAEGRDPTDVELETLAQTWSEHCVHKTFKAIIEYQELPASDTVPSPTPQIIDGLLDTFIRRATEEAGKPWVRSAFVDNAGIVALDDEWDLAFKVETHNHPSALEPFGGANTGVGGVVRDILGVSARPIAVTDVLCFGPQDVDFDNLPEGVLHPRQVAAGVVHGIEDYGNKLGLPTVSGAVLYHAGYTANPLVYCGCLGLLPRGRHVRGPQASDRIVVIGGRTGRDGLHGATFSSEALAHDTGEVAGTVVQIGDPITEKGVLEVITAARDAGLYNAVTDCGAGGLSSAVGEMGAGLGADVELSVVDLKYPGLWPWEIWLSEAQERMVLAAPPANLDALRAICDLHGVPMTDIGCFTSTGRLTVRYRGEPVADLSLDFLHEGLPRRRLRATWTPPNTTEPEFSAPVDPGGTLLRLLNHPNIASKEAVIRRYDHEVRGGTVVKPLVGVEMAGPSDATVLRPVDLEDGKRRMENGEWRGIALSVGINPLIGLLDPYFMAWAAVDEAVRNAVAVGADPGRLALLDNFCWGNPEQPDRLGGLVRAARGCHDAARAYDLPFISGKDSLNNEYVGPGGEMTPIPGTLLISAAGLVPDIHRCVTMDAKAAGNLLYIAGTTRRELGGSHYFHLLGVYGGVPPQPSAEGPAIARAVYRAMQRGLVQACHDLSEGGLGVAAAEMALAGRLGLQLDLRMLPRRRDVNHDDIALFAESLSRYLIEVAPEDAPAFEMLFDGFPLARIGTVADTDCLTIVGLEGKSITELPMEALRSAARRMNSPSDTAKCVENALFSR